MTFGVIKASDFPATTYLGRRFRRKRPTKKVSKPVKTYVKKTLAKMSDYKQRQIISDMCDNPGTAINPCTWTLDVNIEPTRLNIGSSDSTRVGNSVRIRDIRLALGLMFPSYTSDNVGKIDLEGQSVRVLVCQLRPNVTPAEVTNTLNNIGFDMVDDISNNEDFKSLAYVLYDRLVVRKQDATSMISTDGTTTNAKDHVGSMQKFFKIKLKPKIKVCKWTVSAGDVSPDLQGAIYVWYRYARGTYSGSEQPAHPNYYDGGFQFNYMDL